MNMSLYPNTFLFNLNQANPERSRAAAAYWASTPIFTWMAFPAAALVSQFASWISPGLFGAGFQDVTALSHELAEIVRQSFRQQSRTELAVPGRTGQRKVCQNNLEEGDPIEVLANATSAIEVKEKGFDFHLPSPEHSTAAVV